MATVLTDNQNYSNIADAIRGKLGVETTYLPSEMADAIDNIEIPTLSQKTVTANGIYDPSDDEVDGYSKFTVSVPAASGSSF